MRVRIIRESIWGNPGERRVLPVGALCVVVPADNLPAPLRYWAAPLPDGAASGWTEAAAAWAADVGVLLERSDFEPIGVALPPDNHPGWDRLLADVQAHEDEDGERFDFIDQ